METLECLAIEMVYEHIEWIANKFIKMDSETPKEIFEPYFESCLTLIKQRFTFVPWHLYDEVVLRVLRAIEYLKKKRRKEMWQDPRIIRRREISNRLYEILMNSKLKRFYLGRVPESVKTVFWNNLNSMTALEEIDFGSVKRSTKDSLSNLRKCTTLRKIHVITSVTGYAELLLEFPFLEAVCHDGLPKCGAVLGLVQESGLFKEPFQIKAVQPSCFTTKQFSLLNEMCPMINRLGIDLKNAIDLSVVKTLDHLTNLTFVNFKFHEHGMNEFLESHGTKINRLTLQDSSSVNLDVLTLIDRSCPNLKQLDLEEIRSNDTRQSSMEMCVPPFKHLKELYLFACRGADILVEFILSGCFDIEDLTLYFSKVNENTMNRLLAVNPMNKLKRLWVDCPMQTIIKNLKDKNSELEVEEDEWDYLTESEDD